jgi:uncharacterized protein YbjT (DUF2867 family)
MSSAANPVPSKISVIITGATGMVGEGVLFECLEHPSIEQILLVSRKPYSKKHPKLKECIVPDFLKLEEAISQLSGYDACFYCAGVSSVGKSEADYSHLTYDITNHFAQTLAGLNPQMTFIYVSGTRTDSSESGPVMWARVKGKTENALTKLGFKSVYNFRPGFMRPTPGQKNVNPLYTFLGWFYPLFRMLFPNQVSTMRDVGVAMIHCVLKGYSKQILEVGDINVIAKT